MKKNSRQASPKVIQAEQKPTPMLEWMRPWMVIILALLILAPFLGKALTIDDPLFIWQAKHLIQKPIRIRNQLVWLSFIDARKCPEPAFNLLLAGTGRPRELERGLAASYVASFSSSDNLGSDSACPASWGRPLLGGFVNSWFSWISGVRN